MLNRWIFLALMVLSFSAVAQDELEPITPQNVHRLERLDRLGQGGVNQAINWSHDGKWFAVGTATGVWIHNAQDFDETPKFIASELPIQDVEFNADDSLLGYLSNHQLIIIEMSSYEVVDTYQNVEVFEFHPHDALVATGFYTSEDWEDYGTVTIAKIDVWDLEHRKKLNTVTAGLDYDEFSDLMFSPDGTMMLALMLRYSPGCNYSNFVKWWTLEQATTLVEADEFYRQMLQSVNHLVINPVDNSWIAAETTCSRSYADILSAYSSPLNKEIPRERLIFSDYFFPGRITAMALSPDSQTVAISLANTTCSGPCIQFWNTNDKTLVDTWEFDYWEFPLIYNVALRYSPDGTQLAVAGEHQIQIRDVQSGELIKTLGPSRRESTLVHPTGKTLIARDYDNTLRVWQMEQGNLQEYTVPEQYFAWIAEFTPNPDKLLFRQEQSYILWDLKTGDEIEFQAESEHDFAFSPDGASFVVWTEGRVEVRSTDNGEVIVQLSETFAYPTYFTLGTDQLITTEFTGEAESYEGVGLVKVWDAQNGDLLYDLGEFQGTYKQDSNFWGQIDTFFNPDASRIIIIDTYSIDRQWTTSIQIFNAINGQLLWETQVENGDEHWFSDDMLIWVADIGQWLNPGFRVFDLDQWIELELVNPTSFYQAAGLIAISPDNTRIIIGAARYDGGNYSYGRTLLYDTADTLRPLVEYTSVDFRIEFSQEGDMFFVGDEDQTIVYDPVTGAEIAKIQNLMGQIIFGQDRIFVTTIDGTVEIWGVKQN